MEKLFTAVLEFLTEILKKFGRNGNGNGVKVTVIFEALNKIIVEGNMEMANVFRTEEDEKNTYVTILYEAFHPERSETIKTSYQKFIVDNDMKNAMMLAKQNGYISFKTSDLAEGVRKNFYAHHGIFYAELHHLQENKKSCYLMAINSVSTHNEFEKREIRAVIQIAVSNIKNALSGRKK